MEARPFIKRLTMMTLKPPDSSSAGCWAWLPHLDKFCGHKPSQGFLTCHPHRYLEEQGEEEDDEDTDHG